MAVQDFSNLVSPEFSQVGVRDSAVTPGTAEYYNKQSNMAFENPQMLANFVQSSYQKNDVNANNVFDMLKTQAQPVAATPSQPTRTDELQEALFAKPISSQNIYDEEYNKAGLGDLKNRLTDFDNKIAEIKQKYTDKMGVVGENPWLSEASRVGRSRVLADQMQMEIGNYLEQKNQLSDLYNMGMDEVKLRVGLRSDDINNQRNVQEQELEYLLNQNKTQQSRQDAALEFAFKNNITSPFFDIGGTIYRASDLKAYSTPNEFFADGGSRDFGNVQKIEQKVDDKLLSPTEAARLGVPYGTTQMEAAAMSITPGFGKTGGSTGSSRSSKGSSKSSGSSLTTSPTHIKNWILKAKRENPNIPYYDLWGQLTDEMTHQGLNPANYDKIFWEVLHPDGLAGYTQQSKKQTSSSSGGDAIDALISQYIK